MKVEENQQIFMSHITCKIYPANVILEEKGKDIFYSDD